MTPDCVLMFDCWAICLSQPQGLSLDVVAYLHLRLVAHCL